MVDRIGNVHAKLLKRIRRRGRRFLSVLLPPRGRLPAAWAGRLTSGVDGRTWSERLGCDDGLSWFWSPEERGKIIDLLHREQPDCVRNTVMRADRICERHISILGFGDVRMPETMDWSVDPISRQRFPMVRAERVPLILPDDRSDMKHAWEAARFHFAPTLGAAFSLTGDDKYGATLREWVTDFLTKNPCGYGIQWTNPMEVAIRAVNWMVGWSWSASTSAYDKSFVRVWTGAIIEHGRFIRANLERDRRGINTNHYLADLIGLYAIGSFLPEWPESRSWRDLAASELLAEAAVQILPDGFCYESSFGYQRLTFEMWFFFWCLAGQQRENGLHPLTQLLRKMAEFSLWNADERGRLPSFGDCDDGRFVFWQPREPGDHRHVWELAQAALGPLDAPWRTPTDSAPSEDVIWLVGGATLPQSKCTHSAGTRRDAALAPMHSSRLFPNAQIAVLRSRRWLVHAYANPVGTGGVGGHKHNDMLSLTATFDGVPIIIDPGTFAYTAIPAARTEMRRTDAHATVAIDGKEQNRFVRGQLFCLWQDATPEVVVFENDRSRVRIVMRHDGYMRLRSGVVLEREVIVDRKQEVLTVVDRLKGAGSHLVDVVFPLGDVTIRLVSKTTAIIRATQAADISMNLNGGCEFIAATVPGWRSRAYGQRERHKRLVFTASVQAPAKWTSTFFPITAPAIGITTRDSERSHMTEDQMLRHAAAHSA